MLGPVSILMVSDNELWSGAIKAETVETAMKNGGADATIIAICPARISAPPGGIVTEREWGWVCAEQMESEDTV